MKILSKITPAETMLIKDSTSVELKNLMKYTFMDLLLKQVIEIKEISKKPRSKDKKIRTYTYVVSGGNFSKYKPKNHELIYLSPFIKSQSIKILFKNFIKMAYNTSNGSWNYKKTTRSNREINQYFKQSFLLNLFKSIKLTDNGVNLKREISDYLNDIDKKIDNLLHNNKKKGLELLLSIGGNIFLLKNLDFQLLKNIDVELLTQQKALKDDNYYSESDSWLYIDFFGDDYLSNSYFDNFEDTLNSFDSEFDESGSSSDDDECGSCDGCD